MLATCGYIHFPKLFVLLSKVYSTLLMLDSTVIVNIYYPSVFVADLK